MHDPPFLYARHARRFDTARSRELFELPYLALAAQLAPPPGTVLDVGCGGGEPIARWFVERGYDVTGADAAVAMLALCRVRLPRSRWLAVDLRRLALRQRFDVVVAWDSFFHLRTDDQRRVLPTLRELSRPGGVLLFTTGDAEGDAIGELFGDALYHASLESGEYRRLLEELGYEVVRHAVRDLECGGHTVWVARLTGGEMRAPARGVAAQSKDR